MKGLALVSLIAAFVVAGAEGAVRPNARSAPALATASPRLTSNCAPAWRVAETPEVGHGGFSAVAAGSPWDAWAVGHTGGRDYGSPLIEHWNGSKWSVVRSPAFTDGTLNDVVVISRSDAWVVGEIGSYPSPPRPVIEHWDGHRWARVAVRGIAAPLFGVTAVSTRDVWAVGGGESPVTLHWDGTRWTRIPNPGGAVLYDVAASSAHDVWAVGGYAGLFSMHWNGRRWTSFPGPSVGDQLSWLTSVAAVSAKNVWGVGEAQNGLSLREPVVYHWNGRKWQTTGHPSVSGGLTGIVARSAREIWTVSWDDPLIGGHGGTISRWNGKSWHADALLLDTSLMDIALDRRTGLWAVGSAGNPIDEDESTRPWPMIERYTC
jgi:hypothetical protein